MPNVIMIHCNGPGAHPNPVDLDALITPCFMLPPKYSGAPAGVIVKECAECGEGRVVITPEVVRSARERSSEGE